MANDKKPERKRFGHYVPVEVIALFDQAAELYPQFTKQGFFEIVVIAGLNAVNSDDFGWDMMAQAMEIQSKVVEGEGSGT